MIRPIVWSSKMKGANRLSPSREAWPGSLIELHLQGQERWSQPPPVQLVLALVTSAYKSSHKRSAGGTTRVDTPSVHANQLSLCLAGCLPLPITLFAVNLFFLTLRFNLILIEELSVPNLSGNYYLISIQSCTHFSYQCVRSQKYLVSLHRYNLERMWHMKNPCNQGSILG